MLFIYLLSCLYLCFLYPRCAFLCFALNNVLLRENQAVKSFMQNAKRAFQATGHLSNYFDTVNKDP